MFFLGKVFFCHLTTKKMIDTLAFLKVILIWVIFYNFPDLPHMKCAFDSSTPVDFTVLRTFLISE